MLPTARTNLLSEKGRVQLSLSGTTDHTVCFGMPPTVRDRGALRCSRESQSFFRVSSLGLGRFTDIKYSGPHQVRRKSTFIYCCTGSPIQLKCISALAIVHSFADIRLLNLPMFETPLRPLFRVCLRDPDLTMPSFSFWSTCVVKPFTSITSLISFDFFFQHSRPSFSSTPVLESDSLYGAG